MNIVLNESEYVEGILRDHQLGPKPTETLVRVARYYSTVDMMKKSDVRAELEKFMLRCDPSINLVKWQDTLDRIIKAAGKYPMVDIESVPITEKEIALCDEELLEKYIEEGDFSADTIPSLVAAGKLFPCFSRNGSEVSPIQSTDFTV